MKVSGSEGGGLRFLRGVMLWLHQTYLVLPQVLTIFTWRSQAGMNE